MRNPKQNKSETRGSYKALSFFALISAAIFIRVITLIIRSAICHIKEGDIILPHMDAARIRR